MAKTNKKPPVKPWKYCLSGFALVLPFLFLYQQMNPTFPDPLEKKEIGPFTVQPMPLNNEAAYDYGEGYLKDYSLTFCNGCSEKIRYAYMSVGQQPAQLPSDAEGVIHGTSDLKHAHASYPAELAKGDKLWVTVQDWQGKSYHASWPLREYD